MKDYQYLQQKYVVNTYPNRQVTFVRGEGVSLFDQNNKKYLDLMTNYGVNIFGYNYPKITERLISQLRELTTLHGSFTNNIRAEASEALVKKCGDDYKQVYWSNSGAEAMEAALKFAVLTTGKKKFITCKNGYHGKTLGALSATAGEKYKNPFIPLLWEFIEIPFDNVNELKKIADENTAAFIVEPVQGEGGIYASNRNYLTQIRRICEEKNILLIIDEIQTGCGRTGKFLASKDITADILCLGKGLAGGIPVGATIINQKVSSAVPKHIHTSTFGGNPLACAGVLAILEELNNARLKHIEKIGDYFVRNLKTLKSEFIHEVRGQGLMIGIDLKDKRNQILKLLQENTILAIPAGENVIRFLPSYLIEKKHIDLTVRTLHKIFEGL